MSDARFFTVQRTNSRQLDGCSFTRVLSLDIDSFGLNRQQAVKILSMVQIHFETSAEELKYSIDLRLRRRHLNRDTSRELTTITLERNFVAPTQGETNSYTELMNLNWTDTLDRRCWREGFDGDGGDDFDDDDIDISNCRDNDRNRSDFRYTVLIRFNAKNGFTPSNLTAQNRSLSAIVFPQNGEGSNFFF